MRGPQSATTTAAPPSSVMKSRRFSRPNCMRRPSQGNPRQHNALASISQELAAVRDFDPVYVSSGSCPCENFSGRATRSNLRAIASLTLVREMHKVKGTIAQRHLLIVHDHAN
jgi:hypothetical protein